MPRMRRWLFVVVALAACGTQTRPDQAVDAAVDAELDPSLVPFTTTGTTPEGSLEFVQYIRAGFLDGFCPSGFLISLESTNVRYAYDDSSLHLHIPIDVGASPPTGRIAASAFLEMPGVERRTDEVYFDVEQVDLPAGQAMLRIAGRLGASSDGWSFDFGIDMVTPPPVTCF
jgi:hypothetical protein